MRRRVLLFAFAAASWLPQAHADAEFATCRATYAEVGLPARLGDSDVGETQARCFQGFALLHNSRTKVPDWVIESLTIDSFRGTATRSKSSFAADPAIAVGHRAELSDYEASFQGQQFDRGHQAPAADAKSGQQALNETFTLSNMAPQVGIGFNRHAWAYLEKAIRGWVICGGRDHLYVMTGPVYSQDRNKVLGANKVAIPDAFYKIVYDPARGRAIAFMLKNERHKGRSLEPYRTSISEIEELTGIDFLTNRPEREQTILESNVSPMWAYDRSCDLRE
ncbi:MAG: DNA/RNA non-specific endonuclease [Alphaproteobacteria bacterium]|nr:DNA/RNA non-specific endonuclease [Alphaproteobacteria bacterium]